MTYPRTSTSPSSTASSVDTGTTTIAAGVPIALTLVVLGLTAALILLGRVLIHQHAENYWLSPKISSNTMEINGGVAFGSALASGAIAGPMGAFAALPVAALITSLIKNTGKIYEVVCRSGNDSTDDHSDSAPANGERGADPATT